MSPSLLPLFALLASADVSPAPTPAPSVMFLPLNARGNVASEVTQAVGDALLISAGRRPGFRVIGLREVEATMAHEQLKQVAACDSESCAVQIAAALNADQIVFGNLTAVGPELVLTLSRVDARSSTVAGRTLHRAPADKPGVLLDRVDAITAELLGNTPPALAAPAPIPARASPTVPMPPAAPASPAAEKDPEPTALARAGRVTVLSGAVGLAPAVLLLLAAPLMVLGAAVPVLLLAGGGDTRSSPLLGLLAPVVLGVAVLAVVVGVTGLVGLLASFGLVGAGGVMSVVGGGGAADTGQRTETRSRSNTTRKVRRPPQVRAAAREEGVPFCRSGNDCALPQFCKSRGDGMKVCMGNGQHGDHCVSSGDCQQGAFCKEVSDGFKRCMKMSGGSRGDLCNASGDCGPGLFCRDRGDGLEMCM